MEKEQPRWAEVFQVSMPLCLSYIPIGVACGILLNAAGFNPLMTGLVSLLVFSGGAQFMIASMLTVNAPMHTILVMLFFLELRYALLGSSLSQYVRGTSKKFLYFFAVSLNDENYAVNYLKYSTDPTWNKRKALYVNWFSMASWTGSNMIGNMFGSVIHVDADLVHFALTAMFIFMFVMQMKNKLLIFTGLFSGVLGVTFMVMFQNTLGLIAATVIASFAGFALEKAFKKEKAKKLKRLKNRGKHVNEPLFNFPEQESQHHD